MAHMLNGIDRELNLVGGLRLRISSKELDEHLRARAAYHKKRAEEKKAELPRLKEVMESLKGQGMQLAAQVSNFSKGGGYNLDTEHPVESLEKDIKDHHNKAMVFDWFAEHLFPFDYMLEENDLVRLEILKR